MKSYRGYFLLASFIFLLGFSPIGFAHQISVEGRISISETNAENDPPVPPDTELPESSLPPASEKPETDGTMPKLGEQMNHLYGRLGGLLLIIAIRVWWQKHKKTA